ncbi:dipeptidase [Longispora albida]|uniref:dipeptidase n=1 Tax=Longispora albida TaxID=203523 RepID=UPI0003712C3E|nr:dipeptidase [Longispora albida]
MTLPELRAALDAVLPGVRKDLEDLARIPSVAFPGFDHGHVQRSADATAALLRAEGMEVEIVQVGEGQPAVIGRIPAPPGAPTVLLYAHHDVQPAGDPSSWDQDDPFEPVERDGRLYGRGVADDKAGIMAHVAALRAHGSRLPVGVTVFVEGEEEYGSATFDELIELHKDKLAADVIVIADSANWAVGAPALTTSLRGIVNAFVEVSTLSHAVHSGMFGGASPDALTALCRLLATLHDENGDVAIEGLSRTSAGVPDDYPSDRFRSEAGVLDGVDLIGSDRIVDRIWTKPSATVLGIDAPGAEESANALQPSARAKVSIRIGPGDRQEGAFELLKKHLESRAPWGAQVRVTLDHSGNPCVIDPSGPGYEAARDALRAAWDGAEPVNIGIGGSIPFIATFQAAFPEATILVTGIEDPDSRAHGPNESLHLAEFAKACLAEALLLSNLAAGGK